MNGFKPGDLAVYPAHGVGKIESVEAKDFGSITENCYVMRILDNNLTILIPTKNVENVGLRAVISAAEAKKVLALLARKDEPSTTQTWNRRYRGYMEKIKTGAAQEVAEVYRELSIIKTDRELSFGERKVLDQAQTLLVKELSIAQKTEETVVAAKIERIFG